MIKLYVQSTHLKVVYDEAKLPEIHKSEAILTSKFSAKDLSLSNTTMVKRKLASDVRSFYNKDYNILPTGFLPYLEYYYNEEGLKYTIFEMRKFSGVNKEFMKKLMTGEIVIGSKNEKPRDYQIESTYEIIRTHGGLIELPTGSGKSQIIALLCLAYSKARILIIENTVDLVEQTYKKLIDYGFTHNDVGVIQGGNDDDTKRITLLCAPSYEKAFGLFPYVNVIISDEVHENGRTPTAEKIIFSCQRASIRIGLSATIESIDNPFEQMRVYGNFGPIVYQRTLNEQIESDSLSKTKVQIYSYLSAPIQIVGSWGDKYDTVRVSKKNPQEELEKKGYTIVKVAGKLVGKKFLYYGDEYNHFVANKARNKKIVEVTQKFIKENKRILILFNRIEHGKILKEMYPDGILVHGQHDNAARQEAEDHLRKNEGVVVFASKIWAKGKDIEEIDVAINAAGLHSTTNVIQKLGRATRKSRTTDKSEAIYVDFDDSCISPIGRKQAKKRLDIYQNKLELPVERL